MLFDRRGLALTSTSAAAVGHLDRAVLSILAHRKDASVHLAAARAADPGLVVAHCLAGFSHLLLARAELLPAACRALELAREALAERGGTARECGLTEALAEWCAGDMEGAADRLDRLLAAEPLDAVIGKLGHAVRFMLGDAAGMRRAVERMLPSWSDAVPDYGFVLGWRAFALNETGELDLAERVGRAAVAHAPDDVWGCHAVAHVLHTRGQTAAGLAWLSLYEQRWDTVNNFARHLYWHQALFHLTRGEHDAVLALYDRRIRDEPTDDYRDVANAASLLRRLDAQGIAVGARWTELAALAEARIDDQSLVFAQLHYLMSLVGAGEFGTAARQIAAMERAARWCRGSQARVRATIGLPIARTILSLALPGGIPADLPIRDLIVELGGSRIQREIFTAVLDGTAGTGRRNRPAPDASRAV